MNSATPRGVALVTGAGQRIGRAIALDLAYRGWAIAVHYHRSAEAATDLARCIGEQGGRAVALAADLTETATAAALVERAAAALGAVTCLVNNASAFELDGVGTATPETWAAHMEINAHAPFVLAQSLARELPAGATGNIVNLLDQRVWNLTPHFTTYTASKAALWTLTRTLALALAPAIRVNGIGPGPTLPSERQSEDDFARQCAATPLGRGTTPDEICAALRFILSTPSMTGQMIALDGGQHLGWAMPGARTARE